MPPKTKPAELYYKVPEAAKKLRMGRSTLYRLMQAGDVPYTLDPAGRKRFTDADITKILADGHRPKVA